MNFWVGVTDNNWFKFLADIHADEVNFWQPSATPPFRNAPIGMPFLFKLKKPFNHIAGGGFFVTYSRLPVMLAWEIFREKNGAASLDDLEELLSRVSPGRTWGEQIGCTVLANTMFFDQRDWIVNPPGWSGSIVRGKMYDSTSSDGRSIWTQMRDRLLESVLGIDELSTRMPDRVREDPEIYSEGILVKPRLGQSAFRVVITDAYKRRCAITGEKTLVALEAAHVVPYAKEGNHEIRNGLLLRADFHRLFDAGLVSVTPDLDIRVSSRIRENWLNGEVYYRLDGQPLSVTPDRKEFQPDADRLKWHYDNVFQA